MTAIGRRSIYGTDDGFCRQCCNVWAPGDGEEYLQRYDFILSRNWMNKNLIFRDKIRYRKMI